MSAAASRTYANAAPATTVLFYSRARHGFVSRSAHAAGLLAPPTWRKRSHGVLSLLEFKVNQRAGGITEALQVVSAIHGFWPGAVFPQILSLAPGRQAQYE